MGVPVNMNWNEQYTEWRIWVQTEYGWRKVTEGMWFVQDTAFSDLWVAMSDHNVQRKYVEVSDSPKDILEPTWPKYDH